METNKDTTNAVMAAVMTATGRTTRTTITTSLIVIVQGGSFDIPFAVSAFILGTTLG